MAQPKVYEGTGEELEPYLKQFPKQRFRLISLADKSSTGEPGEGAQRIAPNEKGLAIMREIAERQKGRSFTSDGSDTLRLLREARAGAMYDCNPTDE